VVSMVTDAVSSFFSSTDMVDRRKRVSSVQYDSGIQVGKPWTAGNEVASKGSFEMN
jgi:hypothetical protein